MEEVRRLGRGSREQSAELEVEGCPESNPREPGSWNEEKGKGKVLAHVYMARDTGRSRHTRSRAGEEKEGSR